MTRRGERDKRLSPWLTLQHAANVIQNNYGLNGFVMTISGANGTYTAGVIIEGSFTGATGPGPVVFQAIWEVLQAASYQPLPLIMVLCR